MKRRCFEKTNHNFTHYGGRGITVCDAWLKSFDQFVKDVGVRPSKLHTLNRIDNNKDYEPGNVKWSLAAEQNSNKSNTKWLIFDEETRTVQDWATTLHIPRHRIYHRLSRGWSVADTLSVPGIKGRTSISRGIFRGNKDLTFKGETHSITVWAQTLNIPMKTLHRRISQGWNLERALTSPVRGTHNISKSILEQTYFVKDSVK